MPDILDLRVGANGRLVLPKALRTAMGLTGEAKVIATLEGDEVRLTPIRHSARRAQERYRQAAVNPRSVEDFLADRKREAERDETPVSAVASKDIAPE